MSFSYALKVMSLRPYSECVHVSVLVLLLYAFGRGVKGAKGISTCVEVGEMEEVVEVVVGEGRLGV